MTQRFGKRPKYLGNGLDTQGSDKYLRNGLTIMEMAYICGKWLKYLRNYKNMWEMTQICGKQLKYVGNSLSI